MSIVELLVGVAVGMFLMIGAISLFVANITNSRKLLVEARLNQDLRATADLITRDIRRAGYWGNALNGTIVTGTATAPPVNPYIAVAPNSTSSTITYTYSRDVTENNTVDANEQFGFRLSGGAIQMQTSNGTWQTITDTNVMTITAFTIGITPNTSTVVDVRDACPSTCTGSSCPTLAVRSYTFVLTGQSTSDSAVSRTMQTTVRVRNDQFSGACPAA